MKLFSKSMAFASLLTLAFTASAWADNRAEITDVLDRFHKAAAQGDFKAYFETMTADAVFLGTDGTERWQGQAFRDFAQPHFERGGWRYSPGQRSLDVDHERGVAWFDELLSHDKLGQCRGSGVLLREPGGWRIAQYNLSVPIPNELVMEVAGRIQGLTSDTAVDELTTDPEATSEATEAESAGGYKCRKKRVKTNSKAGC